MRAFILWFAVGLVVFGLAWWRGRRAARKAAAMRASREAMAAATLAMAKADAQRRTIENRTREVAQREAQRVEAEEAARVRALRAARIAREAAKRESDEIAARVVPGTTEDAAALAAAEARRRAANTEAERVAGEAAEQARRKAQEHFARKAAEAAADQARRDAEEQAQREAARALHREAEAVARREAEALARREAQALARREAEARARREAEEQARLAAEQAARLEAEAATRRAAESAQREGESLDADLAPAKTPAETLILVADDSKVVRIKATRLLAQHGYRVATAVDGLDAIRQVDAEMPDLIVTDVEMPNLDGFGLARHLKGHARTAHVPIVMITSADASHREIAHGVGVGLVLGKPFPEEPLLEHIRSFRFPVRAPSSTRPDWASTGAGALA